MIHAENIQVRYGSHGALNGVTLTVPDTGVLGLVGPNGSGKTTLLRALYGAARLNSGHILLDGEDISTLARQKIARTVAVVAQDRHAASTSPPLTVAELVLLGRLPHRRSWVRPRPTDLAIVTDALNSVGLLPLAQRTLSELSGGEFQRAVIARTLAQQSRHILLDEPTNHLDIRYQHEVLELIAGSPGSVVVLHDLNVAARYCDQILVLSQGKMVACGTPNEVLVPAVLEPVYQVPIQRVDTQGEITLTFPRFTPASQ